METKTQVVRWAGTWAENRNGEHEMFGLSMETEGDSSGAARGVMRWTLEDTSQENRKKRKGSSEVWKVTGRFDRINHNFSFRLSKNPGAKYVDLVCDVDNFDFMFQILSSGNILTYEYQNPDGWRHVSALVKLI